MTYSQNLNTCRSCPYAKEIRKFGLPYIGCTFPTPEKPEGCLCPIRTKALGECPALKWK